MTSVTPSNTVLYSSPPPPLPALPVARVDAGFDVTSSPVLDPLYEVGERRG